MKIFDSLLISTLSYLPKWFAKPFSAPYVAGETEDEVIMHIRRINMKRMSVTVDILGEHTKSTHEAKLVTSQYCNLYKRIDQESLDCNISIKPTHLGLDISIEEAKRNFLKILETAKTYSNFLRIDMESSNVTDKTFEIFKYCKQHYSQVGVVLQAYLYRTLEDVSKLSSFDDFNSRICKGIYKEPKSLAIQDQILKNKNYLKIAKKMHQRGAYSGFATHNQSLIDDLLSWIIKEEVPKSSFEFQALYGVPMEGRLEDLVDNGYKVRVYVPYGTDWFDYSIRRLKENPNIARYVLKNLFKKT